MYISLSGSHNIGHNLIVSSRLYPPFDFLSSGFSSISPRYKFNGYRPENVVRVISCWESSSIQWKSARDGQMISVSSPTITGVAFIVLSYYGCLPRDFWAEFLKWSSSLRCLSVLNHHLLEFFVFLLKSPALIPSQVKGKYARPRVIRPWINWTKWIWKALKFNYINDCGQRAYSYPLALSYKRGKAKCLF